MSETTIREFEPVATFAAIARALTESLELGEVLRRIASEMLALTQAQGVSVIMPRGEEAEFVAHESPPPHSRIPVGYRFRPLRDIRDMLAGRREPLIILDLHASPLIPDDIKSQIQVRDLILVPLRVDDELLGALIIAFNELPERMLWDPALLRAVGDQAAVAIRNAQLYQAEREATERLLQAEQLSTLGKVVARVAHQLNNPLTTVRLLADGLEDEAVSDAAREQVRLLAREAERAGAVVQELLIFARKGRRKFETVDMAAVVREAIAFKARRHAPDGITVEAEVEDGLPAVHGDARALQQVIANLVHNAAHVLKNREGERRILIRARCQPDDRTISLDIEDSGPGVPPELAARIFEPFFTTKPIGEGTGLGLAIAKEIIDVHDGTIELGTSVLGGAAFRIRLPALETTAASVPMATASPRETTADHAAPPRKLHVLVIDDEAGLQRALQHTLRYLGCEAVSALDGEHGLALARSGSFDLVLCDILVPGLTGPELYDRILQEAPAVAETLAFMTGDSLNDQVRDFLHSTGRPVLAKPFGRIQLEELIRHVRRGGA
jgi:signal transduction histidine kinase/CheY-like chemotaxis protein